MKTYYIELDVSDLGIDASDGGFWRGADMLVAEGDSLDMLLDDAVVYLCDQDGGEAGEWGIGDFPMSIYMQLVSEVEKAYYAEFKSER